MKETKDYLKIGTLRINKKKILFFMIQHGKIELVLENYLKRIVILETKDPLSHTEFDMCAPYDVIARIPIALFDELKIYLNAESQRLDKDDE